MSWLPPLLGLVLGMLLHRAAASRGVAEDGEAIPLSASYPALVVTELVVWVSAAMFCVALGAGPGTVVSLSVAVLAALVISRRVDAAGDYPAWIGGVARIWPTGSPDLQADELEPVALAVDVDPFEEHVLVERVIRLGDTDIDEVDGAREAM